MMPFSCTRVQECDEDTIITDSNYQLLTKIEGRGGFDTQTGEYCTENNIDPREVRTHPFRILKRWISRSLLLVHN